MSGRALPDGYETWSKEDELRAHLSQVEEARQILFGELTTIRADRDALLREVAGLRYYIAQLERNVSPEERAYAAQVAQMMLAAQEAQP